MLKSLSVLNVQSLNVINHSIVKSKINQNVQIKDVPK